MLVTRCIKVKLPSKLAFGGDIGTVSGLTTPMPIYPLNAGFSVIITYVNEDGQLSQLSPFNSVQRALLAWELLYDHIAKASEIDNEQKRNEKSEMNSKHDTLHSFKRI